MPHVYPDQNALINMGLRAESDPSYKTRLDNAISNGAFAVVFSAWHWVETSRTRNLSSAARLADFMDSLNPSWLRDRRDLEKIEVLAKFFPFCKVPFDAPQSIISRVELIAAINRVAVQPSVERTSRQFVEGWINHPDSMRGLIESYQRNADAIRNVRAAVTQGKLTPEKRRQADRELINGLLPGRTPLGVLIGDEPKKQFLEEAQLTWFPSISIEAAIAKHTWNSADEPDWNTFIDRIHLIAALPYVDVIVSQDRYFHSVYPVAKATGFVRARILKFEEFSSEFVGTTDSIPEKDRNDSRD